MMIINNQVILTDRERADQAFQQYVDEGYQVEYYSFVEGYLTALADLKEQHVSN